MSNPLAKTNADRAELNDYLRQSRQQRAMSVDEYLSLQHVKRQLLWQPEFERQTNAKLDELHALYRYQSTKLALISWLLLLAVTVSVAAYLFKAVVL